MQPVGLFERAAALLGRLGTMLASGWLAPLACRSIESLERFIDERRRINSAPVPVECVPEALIAFLEGVMYDEVSRSQLYAVSHCQEGREIIYLRWGDGCAGPLCTEAVCWVEEGVADFAAVIIGKVQVVAIGDSDAGDWYALRTSELLTAPQHEALCRLCAGIRRRSEWVLCDAAAHALP